MSSPAAIDPRIQRLKLITFFGKRLTRRQIADMQEMAASLPGLSRNELGKTVCEHLGWKTKRGRSRVRLAVRVLEELERLGVLSLPEKRRRRRGGDKPVTVTARSAPRPLIDTDLCRRSHYLGGGKGGIVGLFVICYRRTKRGQFGVDSPGRGKGPFSGRSAPFEGPSCYPDCFGGRK